MFRGLYDPAYEHDALRRRRGRAPRRRCRSTTSSSGLCARSTTSSTAEPPGPIPRAATAPGILLALPHGFLAGRAAEFGVDAIPEPGRVALAMCFMPREPGRAAEIAEMLERTVAEKGAEPLGWRDVPTDPEHAGRTALAAAPDCRQLLIGAGPEIADQDEFERRLFVIRRLVEREAGADVHFASFSSRTIVFKGMLTAPAARRLLPRPPRPRADLGASPSSTRASRPTPSRAGRSPTRTASRPTTARSTRCSATSPGCAPARRLCARRSSATTSPAACR